MTRGVSKGIQYNTWVMNLQTTGWCLLQFHLGCLFSFCWQQLFLHTMFGFYGNVFKRIHSMFESNIDSVWNARGMRCIRNILWRVISKTTHFKNNSSLSSITILTHSYWDEWICVIMLTIRPKFKTDTVPMK